MLVDLIMNELIFLFQRKIIEESKCKKNICINVFYYDNKLTYSIDLSNQRFNNDIDLLLISNEFKSHYVYIKDSHKFMFNKTKNRDKKYFCNCCLQCFSNEKVLIEHKEVYLLINSKQNVKLKSGTISFKNYSKQMPVPFTIYDNFECI